MTNATVQQLRAKTDAAWANLTRQLQGMEPHVERSDAPGEWTVREVLSHLLFEPGAGCVDVLKKCSEHDFPVVELTPGQTFLTPERQTMTIRQFTDALDAQRRHAFAYIEALSEADLQRRKVRIPFFKQFHGTDEISITVWVGAVLDSHWNDHAGQLAKIRKAVGLPAAS